MTPPTWKEVLGPIRSPPKQEKNNRIFDKIQVKDYIDENLRVDTNGLNYVDVMYIYHFIILMYVFYG